MTPQITSRVHRCQDGSLYVFYTDGSLRRLNCPPAGNQKRRYPRPAYPTERGMKRDNAMFERQKHFQPQDS